MAVSQNSNGKLYVIFANFFLSTRLKIKRLIYIYIIQAVENLIISKTQTKSLSQSSHPPKPSSVPIYMNPDTFQTGPSPSKKSERELESPLVTHARAFIIKRAVSNPRARARHQIRLHTYFIAVARARLSLSLSTSSYLFAFRGNALRLSCAQGPTGSGPRCPFPPLIRARIDAVYRRLTNGSHVQMRKLARSRVKALSLSHPPSSISLSLSLSLSHPLVCGRISPVCDALF